MTDDDLIRYVDGELDPAALDAFDARMAADVNLKARVEEHRALRAALGGAFDDILAEPVPQRLIAAVRPSPVASLDATRARRAAWRPVIERWGSLAATLVIGLLVGRAMIPGASPLAVDATLVTGLDSPAGSGAIRVGLSYRDHTGTYCRAFNDARTRAVAGIACRDADGWALRVIAASTGTGSGHYKTAASDLPPAVLATLDATIAGSPLDAGQTAAAAARHWRP